MKPLNPKITDWRGKRVWIVGASTGIGEALARELAARSARQVLSARGVERLAALVADLQGAIALRLDASDSSAMQAAAQEAARLLGGLDVVIFNAGTYQPLRAWELTPENIRATLNLNVLGVMDGVAAVLPGMLVAGQGHLVIVGSVAGYRGLPKAAVYGASKAALINFAESIYMDLAPRGIGVSLVSPGFVATPLTAQNDFKMPALITAQQAAGEILKGLARGEFEIHFPKRFSRFLKMLQMLPNRLYFALVSRTAKP
ncbi:SDR family NAD(P)-dependent oxidoreductase [Uliginosibacterium sp. 31-16]|uniref:SDR family NAD(P)-dependent oxidoreductase n=1 Tax=Uliginosibacterium sp. 31-16 TaxID=3068315 RepID=UPI00273FD3CD|nr:SDR family NAD(P)-dependent oxidoreductase [Uliginosibacterium sp. 31-16]MDP5238152.1 SDR family NAD(P)-dependent oxidoreductase [Uliginosibacterium sp. 31-16]